MGVAKLSAKLIPSNPQYFEVKDFKVPVSVKRKVVTSKIEQL